MPIEDYYNTAVLLGVLQKQKVPKPFFLQFFPNQINFEEDKIMFDRVNEDYRRRAPFVAPNVQGKILGDQGYDTLVFKPAYTKPKHALDIDTPFVRVAGETPFTGSLSPEQRLAAKVAQYLQVHRAMNTMTQEYMAASAIINGSVVVEGDDYPRTEVDFQRDNSLDINLVGTAQWDGADADPLGDLRAARVRVNTLTAGGIVRDYVFGQAAWDLFTANDAVKALMDKNYRGSETEISAIGDGFEDSVEYMGKLQGLAGGPSMRLWVYTGKIRNDANQLVDLMDPTLVLGISDSLQGHRCFGAIKDGAAGFKAMEMFPKVWVQNEDPWQQMIMTQSAPLMVPKEPNAVFRLKVTT